MGESKLLWFPSSDCFVLALLNVCYLAVVKVDGMSDHGTVYVVVLLFMFIEGLSWGVGPGIGVSVGGLGGLVRHVVYAQFFGV